MRACNGGKGLYEFGLQFKVAFGCGLSMDDTEIQVKQILFLERGTQVIALPFKCNKFKNDINSAVHQIQV